MSTKRQRKKIARQFRRGPLFYHHSLLAAA